MIKLKLIFFCGLLLSLFVSCDKEINLDEGALVKSFVFITEDSDYHAVIDNKNVSITASGLIHASKIKNVKVELSDGYTIQPDPNSISKWSYNQTFYVSGKGKKVKFNCFLPDLVGIFDKKYIVMGYIRTDPASFDNVFPTIDLSKITHILACFARAKSDGTLDVSGVDKKIEKIIKAAREKNVKVLISVNRAGKGEFTSALETAEKRSILVEQILNYVKKYGIDGFDIDFEEYSDLNNSEFRKKLHAFAKELKEKKPQGLLMTCAVSPVQQYGWGYGDYFDYINVMNYDTFSGRQHASLEFYVNQINNMHNKIGIPFSKLIGGLPFFGFSWDDIPGRDAIGAISYKSILKAYKNQGAADKDRVNETYYNGRPTIRMKCQYAKQKGMPGVMIWDLLHDTDEEEYKLLNVVAQEMLLNKQ